MSLLPLYVANLCFVILSFLAATANVSDTMTCEDRDPATSMPSMSEARNIQKGQNDLGDGLDDDIDKSVALEELEEVVECVAVRGEHTGNGVQSMEREGRKERYISKVFCRCDHNKGSHSH